MHIEPTGGLVATWRMRSIGCRFLTHCTFHQTKEECIPVLLLAWRNRGLGRSRSILPAYRS